MHNETNQLIESIAEGQLAAVNTLLERFRARLRNVVELRIDDRVRGRFDPSDVVQDALAEAAERLPAYARERPIPFYPWLRRIAIDRLLDLHRRHLDAARRSVNREISINLELSNGSRQALVNSLIARDADSPSVIQRRRELAQSLIDRLSHDDREVLVLRYLEQATNQEAAAILEISENACAQRHVRALRRIRSLLEEGDSYDD